MEPFTWIYSFSLVIETTVESRQEKWRTESDDVDLARLGDIVIAIQQHVAL